MMAPPALSMKPDIVWLTQLIEIFCLIKRQARPTKQQVGPTYFGFVSNVVEAILSGVKLPQANQAMRMRDITTKIRLDTMHTKVMNTMSLV